MVTINAQVLAVVALAIGLMICVCVIVVQFLLIRSQAGTIREFAHLIKARSLTEFESAKPAGRNQKPESKPEPVDLEREKLLQDVERQSVKDSALLHTSAEAMGLVRDMVGR